MDAAQERSMATGDGGSADAAAIVKILNQHQNSLAELEGAARRLEHDLMHLNRTLASPAPASGTAAWKLR
jgi:4-diphosphocytidyl-2C-methyl-D-erythritol kinase